MGTKTTRATCSLNYRDTNDYTAILYRHSKLRYTPRPQHQQRAMAGRSVVVKYVMSCRNEITEYSILYNKITE